MITVLEVVSLVFVLLGWFPIARSESVGSMTGPPKHRGFFLKQSGRNKTIPISERPGEEMIVFDVGKCLLYFIYFLALLQIIISKDKKLAN